MTVTVYRDEPRRRAFWTIDPPPGGPVSVQIGDTWHPVNMDGTVGAVILCGPDVDPVPPGSIQVTADVLPVLDINGEFFTNDWIRLRTR